MKKFKLLIISGIFIICIIFSIYSFTSSKNARIVFLSDTHAVVDSKDRDINWNKNTFTRIKSILSNQNLKPTHIVWLGDIIDFMPEEWEIVKIWIDFISENSNAIQYAVMGNHDYNYYDYPEAFYKFYTSKNNSYYLGNSIEDHLISNINVGDISFKVNDAGKFLIGYNIIIIEKPGSNTQNNYIVGTVKSIDVNNNIINLEKPITRNFSNNDTTVRQGLTESIGINYFLNTFKNTKTQNTKDVFYVEKNCFILMSMDNFFNRDIEGKSRAISESDFIWFEKQLMSCSNKYNIIVVMHELPQSGNLLGGIYDPNDVIDYDEYTRKKFKQLINKFHITAWVSGHNHPDVRNGIVNSIINYGNSTTNFFISPSLGTNSEGQVLVLDIDNDSKLLNFRYWSIDKNEIIKTIAVPIIF